MTKQKYIVMVDDNFNFMDEDERYKDGEFDSYDEAVAKCREIVDDYLLSALKPGMTATQLYSSYQMFGEDPFIVGHAKYPFSAWDYAQARCRVLTAK